MLRYTALMEKYCRVSPYNWFNFFDFWAMPEPAEAAKGAEPSATTHG